MSDQPGTIDTTNAVGNEYPPDPDFAAQANARPEMYDQEPEQFWDEQARQRLDWFAPYGQVLEWNPPM